VAHPRSHLAKAPLREALINIRLEQAVELALVRAFIDDARPQFERETTLREAVFSLAPEGPATANEAVIGWRLDCDKTHYVLMCTVSGFTLSRLSPYGDWTELQTEARRWWTGFCARVTPQRAVRLAVRYINAITLPTPVNDFADYLVSPPVVPTELPQAVSGFLQRTTIPDPANNCVSIVTQALEGLPDVDAPPQVTVLLDIDVFRIVRLSCQDDERIWSELDELRVQKNKVFFSHLTERTVEMFE